MRNFNIASLALVPLLSLSAVACDWNTVTTGDHGVLTFTPDDCGQDGCDLRDPLVFGGTAEITLDSVDANRSVDGLRLISSNPNVVQVELMQPGSLSSEWRIVGVGRGKAEIIAIDYDGYEIDHTDVEVDWADRLSLDNRFGDAVGPEYRAGFDEVWTVNANDHVKFQVEPVQNSRRMMGALAYDVDIDSVLYGSLSAGASIEAGQLDFTLPPGEFDVSFTAPDGAQLRVLIVAK